MRVDLAFFVCCCKSFLGDDSESGDLYSSLGVERDASPEDIKRAYKKKSLQMHPDKLAQRGQTVTPELQAEFTKMKEAYEILSDPHKRETYDAIGERGIKWLEEPFSIDPQELAHNFAKSSIIDRSKIFGIFVGVAVAVLILPILVCLHLDGVFGKNASWFATFIPLWIWNGFMIFYYTRVILMGPIERPEHIPPEEWIDPLPMNKRYMSLFRFVLLVLFELFATLKLDGVFKPAWIVVFTPLFFWELTTLYKKYPVMKMRIVTLEDLESALGKSSAEFTDEEKELIAQRYSVVPSLDSEQFEAAQKLKARARRDMITSSFRLVFMLFLLIQLDGGVDWSWWVVFLPVWVMSILVCIGNYHAFAHVQQMAAAKDPTLFGLQQPDVETGNSPSTNYGAVGVDGSATPDAASTPASNLSEEEKEELKAQVMASASNLFSKCCTHGFILVLVCMFVAKIQGASFSSLWIISPFLLAAGIILCCFGCAIFGISEVPPDGVHFDATQGEQQTPLQDATTASPTVPAESATYYAPPPENPQTAVSDPENGIVETSASANEEEAPTPQPPVDLLDSGENGSQSNPSVNENMQELD